MTIPLLDLVRQYQVIKDEAQAAINDVLEKGHYILGENVQAFEKEFAGYVGTKYAISVGNGTDALVIALKALEVGPGDEVITAPYSFFATAEAIMAVGATPVFVDVDERTFNLAPDQIEKVLTKRTKGIIPVHVFGQCADMRAINELAKAHGLFVLEDACQAVGAGFGGKMAGSLGDIAAFSFFPTKNLGGAGDGGMLVTDREDLAVICTALRAHASGSNGRKAYELLHHEALADNAMPNADGAAENKTVYDAEKYFNYLPNATNSRLDEIQAALLRIKLRKLGEGTHQRRQLAAGYTAALAGSSYTLPYEDPAGQHCYHLYILQHERREAICEVLKRAGIATGIYYPVPLHLQKACTQLGYKEGDLPVVEALSHRTFAVPLFPGLTQEEQDYIVENLLQAEKGA